MTLDDIINEMKEIKESVKLLTANVTNLINTNNVMLNMIGEKLVASHEYEIINIQDKTIPEIKEIILGEYVDGEKFYPSDIAIKHHLDYDNVVTAIQEISKEGKIIVTSAK